MVRMAMQLQRIVILGLQASDHRLLLMIAAQSPMIVYEDSSDHWAKSPQTMGAS